MGHLLSICRFVVNPPVKLTSPGIIINPASGLLATETGDTDKPSTGVEYKPDELLVKLKPNVTARGEESVFQNKGAIVAVEDLVPRRSLQINSASKSTNELEQWRVVKLASNADLLATKTSLAQDPSVETVELNYLLSINSVPIDPEFGLLWGLNNTGQAGGIPDADIDLPEARDIETGSKDVVVAVIDTGVNYNHPDLQDNMWRNPNYEYGYDFVDEDPDPMDDNGHGTAVAGIIGAVGDNSIGVVGVSPKVSIMSLKSFNSEGNGSISDVVQAVEYAIANGAKVINASFGQRLNNLDSQVLKAAIDSTQNNGVLLIAAAGNNGSNNVIIKHYPASYDHPNIISVAAANNKDELSGFSNFGANVDLGAPGGNNSPKSNTLIYPREGDIYSTGLNNDYGWDTGTSMATAYVTGAAALLLAQDPNRTFVQLKDILMNATNPLPSLNGKTVTGGRLNVWKALNRPPVLNYGPTTTPWHYQSLLVSNNPFEYVLPGTFTDPDPGDTLTYTATLESDGNPLPLWLKLDEGTGKLSVDGPPPAPQQLKIKLTATDRLDLSVSDDDPYNKGWRRVCC